jgi:DNA-binding transcriptional LysR family regulator
VVGRHSFATVGDSKLFRYLRNVQHNESDSLANLQLWRTFLAIHATGSLSAAARQMGITQPAVSAQLQTLERLIGERLFVRGARGVTPTARAVETASRLAGPFEQLSAALEGAGAGAALERAVRLGGAAELLAEVVAPAIAPLISRGLLLQLAPGITEGLVDALLSGTLDLVVASERPRGRRILASPLVDETFVLIAGAAMAHSAQDLVTENLPDLSRVADALEQLPLLAYAYDVPLLRRYWRHVFGTRLEREPALTMPDLRALRDAAIGGAGVTVLPSYLCRPALSTGALVDLYPTDDPPINTLYLLQRPGTAGRANVAQVSEVLTSTVASIVEDGHR